MLVLLTAFLTYYASMQMPMLLAEMIILGMFVFPALAAVIGLAVTAAAFLFRLAPFRRLLPGLLLSFAVGVGLVGTAMTFDAVSDYYFHVAMQKKKLTEDGESNWNRSYAYPDQDLVLQGEVRPSFFRGAIDLYGLYDKNDDPLTEMRTVDELWDQLKEKQKLSSSAKLEEVEIDHQTGDLRFRTEEPNGQFLVKPAAANGEFTLTNIRYLDAEVTHVD